MQPFADQPLPGLPHIAVIGSDKVGNFVVTTPLLRGLREKYPGVRTDFFGSEITRDFEEGCPFIDARFSLYGSSEGTLSGLQGFVAERTAAAGPYDLVINCNGFSEASMVVAGLLAPRFAVGPALTKDLRGRVRSSEPGDARAQLQADLRWNRPNLATDYPDLLRSGSIAEILCCLAYIETDFARTEVPQVRPARTAVPEVLLHTKASRSAKEWPVEYWREVVSWCQRAGWTVGVVGAAVTEADPYDVLVSSGAADLRGAFSLPELAGAFRAARAAVVVDSGPMHIAASVGCPTVCVFGNDSDGDGASPIHLWAPSGDQVHLVRTPWKCGLCAEARFRNADCPVPGHPCLTAIEPRTVVHVLASVLGKVSLRVVF